MASISDDGNGRRRIQFIDRNGKRKTIRLVEATQRDADEFCTKVESLNVAAILGKPVDNETARWVKNLGNVLHAKLVKAGLATPRASVPTLGAFLQSWIGKRAGAKPNSVKNYKMAVAKLTEFFGDAAPLDTITAGRADDFARAMADKFAKEWTWRLVKFARQFFHAAVRDKLITENPFAGVKPPARASKSREFFISRDAAQRILDACPDAEWRLIFTLARYAGLRVPS